MPDGHSNTTPAHPGPPNDTTLRCSIGPPSAITSRTFDHAGGACVTLEQVQAVAVALVFAVLYLPSLLCSMLFALWLCYLAE